MSGNKIKTNNNRGKKNYEKAGGLLSIWLCRLLTKPKTTTKPPHSFRSVGRKHKTRGKHFPHTTRLSDEEVGEKHSKFKIKNKIKIEIHFFAQTANSIELLVRTLHMCGIKKATKVFEWLG